MVGAKVSGRLGPTYDAIKHTADRGSIKCPSMDSETDDSSSILIHDDHYPVGLEGQGFASKEIHAPQTVSTVA